MDKESFLIIDCGPDQKRTIRENELKQARIRAHVSTGVHRRKKAHEAAEILPARRQSKTSESVQLKNLPARFRSQITHGSASNITSLLSHESLRLTEAKDALKCFPTFEESFMQKLYVSPVANNFGHSGGYGKDPFGYISPRATATVDYFTRVIVPNHSTMWKMFNVHSRVPQALLELLQHDDCFFAVTNSQQVSLDSPSNTTGISSRTFASNHSKSFVNLRKRLPKSNGRVDEITILAVIALLVTAMSIDDTIASKVHVQHISALIKSAGGFENLGLADYMKSLVMQWDMQLSYQQGVTGSIFPNIKRTCASTLLNLPFSPNVLRLVEKLLEGFQILARRGVLPMQTLEVLTRAVEASSDPLYCSGRVQYHHDPRLYFDLWEACPCLLRTSSDEDRLDLEQTVAQALILYCLQNFTPIRLISFLLCGVRTRLTANLCKLRAEEHKEEDVIFRVSMNAIDSWREIGGNESLMPHGAKLLQVWAGTDFENDAESVVLLLRMFLSNIAFEQRCLRHLRTILGPGTGNDL